TGELEGEKKVSQKPFFLPRPSHAAVFDGGGGVFEARKSTIFSLLKINKNLVYTVIVSAWKI
ncbi:MAG: hypothetical protein AAF849_25225, partial [Bacteroidota bacterium]